MILSVHLVASSQARAVATMLRPPKADRVEGLRYCESWLTAELRHGFLPSLAVTGAMLVAAWDDDGALDRFMHHPRARPYAEGWSVRLEPARSIGAWPGLPDLPRHEVPIGSAPVAAFTRAKVRPQRFLPFVAASADAEKQAVGAPGFIDGLTVLRPPLLIGTFTLWESVKSMRKYAMGTYPGGHVQAMKKDAAHSFHSEMLFARFRAYDSSGNWRGRDPLAAAVQVGLGEARPPINGGDAVRAYADVPDLEHRA